PYPKGKGLQLPPQLRLSELQAVIAPEAALADEDRRHSEDASREREIGVLAQAVLDPRLLRRAHERPAVQARRGERALDLGGVRDVRAFRPVGAKERVHGLLPLPAP